ncbi:MAG: glucose-1-phosphate cytidylyltransferase [Pseudohaliea sp.]
MKVAILAGGVGSRLGSETESKPKPMVDVGGRPLLWHIMGGYARHGFRDFSIALGYKGDIIKQYFADLARLHGHVSLSLKRNRLERHGEPVPDWDVDLVETGLRTQTGGRVRRLGSFLGEERFLLAWGDGVHDIDLPALLAFHEAHGRLASVVAVRPPARFGHLEFDGDRVVEFSEKPQAAEGWINGGVFVLEPGVLDYIEGDRTAFERAPLEGLARDGELMAFRHRGFWQCVDTPRDLALLKRLWDAGAAPWSTA